jgi:hypothetical protein
MQIQFETFFGYLRHQVGTAVAMDMTYFIPLTCVGGTSIFGAEETSVKHVTSSDLGPYIE